jgi:hypothetical protein
MEKKVDKYLICETADPGIVNLFTVSSNPEKYDKVKYVKPRENNFLTRFRMPIVFDRDPHFPIEIVIMIMHEIIHHYLASHGIQKAMKIICICRYMIEDYFDRFCGRNGELVMMEKFRRLSSLFRVASGISSQYEVPWDEFVLPKMVILCQGVVPKDKLVYAPFQIALAETMVEEVVEHIRVNNKVVKMVRTGPGIRHMTMMHGEHRSKYFYATKVESPVFIFDLYEAADFYTVPNSLWQEAHAWHLFAKLLKIMHGPHTGVYVVKSHRVFLELRSLTEI